MDLNDKAPEQYWSINKILIVTLIILFFLVLGKAYYLLLAPIAFSLPQVLGLVILVIAELVGLVIIITNLIIKETNK